MSARFIAVAGNIGAGKSTLVGFLEDRFGLTPLYEPVEENPYLADFYCDMKTYSFHSQIFYLTRKYALHIQAQRSQGKVVLDRSIYEDAEIFAAYLNARNLLANRDWRTYRELYDVIRSQIQPPDLLVYLRCSMRALTRRIRMRGRHEERNVPRSYLKRLNERYDAWFESYDFGPKAVLETEKLDYITDLVDRVELIEQIEKLLG
ncbi:MAG: deoxynucleoside kinase [Bradymonadales bacterium]|nr:deoxynucleoside kinase [Bradymonadales bacterium]